jgi:2'-5' RNA ligase
MKIGAAFIFDSETEATVRGVWQSIADAGLPSFMLGLDYPPHMTIFAAEEVDPAGLRLALHDLAAHTHPLEVSFLSLAHFLDGGAVAYLSPVVNHALLDLHQAAWDAATPYTCDRPEYYAPGVWVPHVTVAFNTPPEQVGPVAAVLARARPLKGTICAILLGVFNIDGGSQYERIELCG